MKKILPARRLAFLLLVLSVAFYWIDYLVFGEGKGIAAGFLGNLAFLPLYVLFVTLMIEKVLKERERHAIRQKLNMVIGVFFSEVGCAMLRDCLVFVENSRLIAERLEISPQWTAADFRKAAGYLHEHALAVNSRNGDLEGLKSFLVAKRGFMLGLLENPNLLEHDEFTDLLWAVFHLIEELEARRSFAGLSSADLDHLSGDIKRAYGYLLREWVAYIQHLKQDYPYLFSLAVRTNPLVPGARAELN